MSNPKIKVLIVDDHQLVIDGIKLMINDTKDIECVGEANNGKEAVNWVNQNQADIIIMDINMPEMDGIEACKILNQDHPETKVIFLSMINQLEMIHILVSSGAKGYLLKNAGAQEVIEAIRQVYQGVPYFDSRVFSASAKANNIRERSPVIPRLSPREKEVLTLIMEEYTSQEIAKKLFISSGTVETHRRNLISKLGVKNTAGLVRVAMEYKLI